MERSECSDDRKLLVLFKERSMFEKIMSVKDLLFSFEKFELDFVEYVFFKVIVLFNLGMFSLFKILFL